MMKRKIAITVLSVAAAAAVMSGCGGKKTEGLTDYDVKIGDSYPIQTEEKLTYWVQLHESVAQNYGNLNETPFGKALVEKTGVQVEFIHPPVSQVSEKFNLMIASQEYPDIIEWGWYNFTGGPHTAVEDGVILPLNQVFEKSAPNLSKILKERPVVAKEASTDEGEYYCFPMIRENDYLNTYLGPMFRKDILDKIGCDVPETIDEWDNVLHKMKAAGVEVPLATVFDNSRTEGTSSFLGAYGVAGGFYQDNGKIKYGPYEQEAYTKYVTLIKKWYDEGLLDPDFVDTDQSRMMAMNTSGKWGALFGSCGGVFGTAIPAIQKANPSAQFVPAKYPVLTKGETPKFGQKNFDVNVSGGCAAISTQCRNVELAARFLDFAYSEEGFMLYNFGIEGESYQMEGDFPKYTEKITNSELPMGQALGAYARASYFGPFVQAENYMRQYAKLDVQKEAIDVWSDNTNTEYVLPNVTYTSDENSEYSNIMADIDTYRQEMFYAIVTGTKSLDDLSTYYDTLKSMGIERAIEINQAAYDRYLNR